MNPLNPDEGMSMMHCHHPTAAGDNAHIVIKQLVQDAGSRVKQIYYTSFFLEFSFLLLFEKDPNVLKGLADGSPEDFASFCWEKHIIPVTCRFGQGAQKKVHAHLLKAAFENSRAAFADILIRFWKARVLSEGECMLVDCILQLPPDGPLNRMSALVGAFGSKRGYGSFSMKNLVESLVANQVWENSTQAELVLLPSGNGAKEFWRISRVKREAMVASTVET